MKKSCKHIVVLLIAVLALSGFSGCGTKKPSPEDAQAYLQAVLDLMCTGDYDHSVQFADVEEGHESEVRDALVGESIKALDEENELDDQIKGRISEFMIAALGKTKYTVGDAVGSGDGEYDVTVSIEPLRAYAVLDSEEFDELLEERIQGDYEKVVTMSEAEKKNYVWEVRLDALMKALDDPQYDKPVEVIVHYGKLDGNGSYGCTTEEGKKLGEQLFSTEGMEQAEE